MKSTSSSTTPAVSLLSSREKKHLLCVAGSGAAGGVGLLVYNALVLDQRTAERDIPLALAIPGYGFLGAICSIFFLYSAAKQLSSSKLIQLSLGFGIAFPALLNSNILLSALKGDLAEAYSTQQQIIADVSDIAVASEEETVSVGAIKTLSEAAQYSSDRTKEKVIESLAKVSQKSTNEKVQLEALETLETVARGTTSDRVKENAVAKLAKVSQKSTNEKVQLEALETIEEVATEASDDEVKENAVKTLTKVTTQNAASKKVQLEALETLEDVAQDNDTQNYDNVIESFRSIVVSSKTEEVQLMAVDGLYRLAKRSTKERFNNTVKALSDLQQNEVLPYAVQSEISLALQKLKR